MQVAARGPSGGAHACDDLANLHPVAGMNADGLQVVVGGDESIAVVDLYPVAAAPWMPAGRPHNTRISCVDGRAAGRRIILSQMEVPRSAAKRADPETERRTRIEELERCHQEAGQRPARTCGSQGQGTRTHLPGATDRRVREGQRDLRTGQDCGRKRAGHNLV